MTQPLPAPQNKFVEVLNRILDTLIKGLGADMAIAVAIAEAPWLGWPVVTELFRYFIRRLSLSIDDTIKKNADIIVIRFQNDIRKAEYDSAIEPIKNGNPTPEEIKRAEDAIDRIISRAH